MMAYADKNTSLPTRFKELQAENSRLKAEIAASSMADTADARVMTTDPAIVVKHDISEILFICRELEQAYADPTSRRIIDAERAEILDAYRRLIDALTADERAMFRQLKDERRQLRSAVL